MDATDVLRLCRQVRETSQEHVSPVARELALMDVSQLPPVVAERVGDTLFFSVFGYDRSEEATSLAESFPS